MKPGTRLGGQAVVTLLRDLAQACGVDGKLLGAHSLRAGCVTAAAEAGVPESLIMNRTGHKSLAMVHRYVRPVSVWRNNPLARVL